MSPERTDADKIKALAHPCRRRIMELLISKSRKASVSPSELATELGVVLSNVSYHVRVLADYDAITLEETRPVGGSLQHFYAPDPSFMTLPWVKSLLDRGLPDADAK